MSSFIRRIQRQVMPSLAVHYRKDLDGKPTGDAYANQPRAKFYQGRGNRLGTKNPKDKALLARQRREKRGGEPQEEAGAKPKRDQ
ncbi:hypothetical protein GRI39_02150 [Altererythrobacter indicus]|uniref:Uncharacterized protein n=1 Tax=Altericroceibacterium indicum TaxID=374177 RepID=A0A845A664_9SPHN|nr:hypothetical protein [Altericroceibacterium indicum]MXP24849.1 hypothetical protein [Altericroceibacterium indicum]